MGRPGFALVPLLAAVLLLAPFDAAGEGGDETSPPPAVEAISATIEVERVLLKEDLEHHERIVADRSRSAARLSELYTELDASLKKSDPQLARTLEEIMDKVSEAEDARANLVRSESALLERVQDRLRRLKLLEDRIGSLQDRVSEVAGPLAGRWDVALLPSGEHGSFSLSQSGTLVSGTYQIEGGWTGSLQGTLVNRKVHLERIDSKLGRSAEFEGYLSVDGTRIRGTWRSYELSAQEPSSGQWSAVRRAPS